MGSESAQTEEDIALGLQKVFRVFACTLKDESELNDARAVAVFVDQIGGDTAQALEQNMKGMEK